MVQTEASVIVSECLPDLVRLSLTSSINSETDRNKQLMWRSVLDGYDAGLITGKIDILNTRVNYQPAEIN